MDRQMDGQTDEWTDIDRQMDRQTDKQLTTITLAHARTVWVIKRKEQKTINIFLTPREIIRMTESNEEKEQEKCRSQKSVWIMRRVKRRIKKEGIKKEEKSRKVQCYQFITGSLMVKLRWSV